MTPILIAILMFPLAQGVGNNAAIQAGKAFWEDYDNDCKMCHGRNGDGAFGPDLAGHQLTSAQFLRAVRQPWGIMPAFAADKNISDQQVAQVSAYLASLPKNPQPTYKWFTPVPPLASSRQQLMVSFGCGQCHSTTMANPRRTAGGAGADWEWFKSEVYEHTTGPINRARPHLRMGNYSRLRVPEPMLRELWQFFSVDQGLRVPISAQVSAPVRSGDGFTYTITVQNGGVRGKGLAAENITLLLPLPPGPQPATAVTINAASGGDEFFGIRRDSFTNSEAAAWEIPQLWPGDKKTYTLTISGPGAGGGFPRGMISWAKPLLGTGAPDQAAVTGPRQ